MSQILKNVLYLLTPGLYLHRDHLSLRIEEHKQLKLALPIHNLEAILVFGHTMVSPSAMKLCWEHNVPISFLDENGRFLAQVEGIPKGSVLLRRRQHQAASDPAASLAIAKPIVAGKLANLRRLHLRSARENTDPQEEKRLRQTAREITWLLQDLPQAPHHDALRGLEGQAAALSFENLHLHLKPKPRKQFPFQGRNRRPPRDPLNCILSFLYALFRQDCLAALAAAGLDPFVGYLHADRPGRESLALDLMEEFRPRAERLAITLINRAEIKPNHLATREGGACELTETGRKTLVAAHQTRKRNETTHPLYKQKVRHAQIPFIQARLLAQTLRGDLPEYLPHPFD